MFIYRLKNTVSKLLLFIFSNIDSVYSKTLTFYGKLDVVITLGVRSKNARFFFSSFKNMNTHRTPIIDIDFIVIQKIITQNN